jgi:hypothetical protein
MPLLRHRWEHRTEEHLSTLGKVTISGRLFCKCGFEFRDSLGVGEQLENGRVLKVNGKSLHRSLHT